MREQTTKVVTVGIRVKGGGSVVVGSLLIVIPIVGFCYCSIFFFCALLCVQY